MGKNNIPLILNDEGLQLWLDEHPTELPEVVVTAPKPLTEFELRDKRNAVRLGLIEDSDDAYRQWKNRVHKANLRDITIGTAGAGAAMGLASLFTMANPASLYAYGAMGVSNLPNQVDKIKYDINTKLYTGAAADAGLTAMELLPVAQVASPAVKSAIRFGDGLYRKANPYYDFYRTIRETKLSLGTTGNKTITKLGDLEIDNPNLFYRQDAGTGGAFLAGNTAFVKDGIVYPGRARLEGLTDYSWWNKGKPYLTVNAEHPVGGINGQEMPRIFTTNDPSLIKVRDLNYPIGLWNGKRGFVQLSEYVTSKPVDVSQSTYMYEPGYGYRKVTTPSKTISFGEVPKRQTIMQVTPLELAEAIAEMQGKNGYYMYAHGTGRTNPDPNVFLNSGLRIPGGETSNTAVGMSDLIDALVEMLTNYPHANSKDIVLLPANSSKVLFGPAGLRFNTDWFTPETFEYVNEDIGRGLRARHIEGYRPTIDNPYTTTQAPLGVYNSQTGKFLINPNNLYFSVVKENGKLKLVPKENSLSELESRFINRGKKSKRVRGEHDYWEPYDYADYSNLNFEDLFKEALQTALARSLWAKDHYKYDNILDENFEVNTKFPNIEIDPINKYSILVNGGPAKGSYVPLEHKIRLPKNALPISGLYPTLQEIESVPYHELLHAAGVQTPFYIDKYQNKTVESALSRLTDYRDSYYTNYRELPVYGLELGRLVGIKPYENKYPGIEKMKEIAKKLWSHPVIKNMKHTEEGYKALYDWLRGALVGEALVSDIDVKNSDLENQSYKLGGQIKRRIKL